MKKKPTGKSVDAPQKDRDKNGIESAYVRGRREWNEQIGNVAAAAQNWQRAAIASIAVSLVAVAGVVWIGAQSKVVPYAVEFNGDGEVMRVEKANVALKPSNKNVAAAMRNWVINARTVSSDARAEQVFLRNAYAATFPGSPAYQNLVSYHRDANPYARAQKETVTVDVNVVSPISDKTWQVEWTETARNLNGAVKTTERLQATITIGILAPTTQAQVLENPQGIFVRDFSWVSRL